MKEDYKILVQAVLYSTVGTFLVVTLAIFMLRYGIWLWQVFPEKTPPAIEMTQKQTDEMCVKWWFDSDLTAAKKRVCGK
jgi:hypothetical protein